MKSFSFEETCCVVHCDLRFCTLLTTVFDLAALHVEGQRVDRDESAEVLFGIVYFKERLAGRGAWPVGERFRRRR